MATMHFWDRTMLDGRSVPQQADGQHLWGLATLPVVLPVVETSVLLNEDCRADVAMRTANRMSAPKRLPRRYLKHA